MGWFHLNLASALITGWPFPSLLHLVVHLSAQFFVFATHFVHQTLYLPVQTLNQLFLFLKLPQVDGLIPFKAFNLFPKPLYLLLQLLYLSLTFSYFLPLHLPRMTILTLSFWTRRSLRFLFIPLPAMLLRNRNRYYLSYLSLTTHVLESRPNRRRNVLRISLMLKWVHNVFCLSRSYHLILHH